MTQNGMVKEPKPDRQIYAAIQFADQEETLRGMGHFTPDAHLVFAYLKVSEATGGETKAVTFDGIHLSELDLFKWKYADVLFRDPVYR